MIVFQDVTYIDRMANATYIEHDVGYMLKGKGKHLALYWWLKKFHNKEEGYAYPNIEHNKTDGEKPQTDDLVSLLGYTKKTVIKLLKELEEIGLIDIIKVSQGTGARVKNRYKVYQPYEIEDKYFDAVFDKKTMKCQKTTTANSGLDL
ncbi:MAG: helix-turn-helix domain-containing protein [Paraclostridium sp.]